MRSITESIEVSCSPERLFQTLHTPNEICMWWSARTAIVVPRQHGLWAATWGKNEDQPDYVVSARIKNFDPPKLLVLGDFEYWTKDRPLEFAHQLSTTFCVEPLGENAQITVTQSGFPDSSSADEYFRGCCQGWKTTLAAIKDYF